MTIFKTNYPHNIERSISFNTSEDYLTEKTLGDFLEIFFEGYQIIKNSKYKKTRYKPDYYLPELKLIFEYDGPRHYTETATALTDLEKDLYFKSEGITIKRIPFFVQLSKKEINHEIEPFHPLKGKLAYNDFNNFPHGFITTKFLPANFCALGVARFYKEMDERNSLYDKYYKMLDSSLSYQVFDVGMSYFEVYPCDRRGLTMARGISSGFFAGRENVTEESHEDFEKFERYINDVYPLPPIKSLEELRGEVLWMDNKDYYMYEGTIEEFDEFIFNNPSVKIYLDKVREYDTTVSMIKDGWDE